MTESRQGSDHPTERASDPRSHRYDSFVLRLWMRGDPATVHRVELRHVQTETIATATNVTLDWVHGEMVRLLGQGECGDVGQNLIGDE